MAIDTGVRRPFLFRGPVLRTGAWLATLAIVAGSLWPLPELPGAPGTDKVMHFLAYSVMSFLWLVSGAPVWRWIVIVALGCMLLGGLIEGLQPLVNRHAEWMDVAANAGGVAIGVGLGVLCLYVMNRLHGRIHDQAR